MNDGWQPAPVPERDEPRDRLEVDGEVFELRAAEHGGTHYDWVSGPNEGYGFTSSGNAGRPWEEHKQEIRAFLAQVDPSTGYLED